MVAVSIPSLSQPALLVMWVQLLVVVLVARALGGLARRYGQPPVVGELLAGVVLGPSVLAQLWPAGFAWLFPPDPTVEAPLSAIGWIGVAFLLMLTGFDLDLGLVRRMGRAATWTALGGLLVPLAAGIAVGIFLPPLFVGRHATQPVFVLFVAVTMAITALPVISKIIAELGYMRRDFGQLTVAVGTVNDLVGWLALGVLAGLASSGVLSPVRLVEVLGGLGLALAASFTLGQRGVDRLLRAVRARTGSAGAALAANVTVALLFAAVYEAVHSDAVLGTFVAGMVFARSASQHPGVRPRLEALTVWVLAPVFFAGAGLRLNLAGLANPRVLTWSGIILAVAVATKLVGGYAGARAGRMGHRDSLAVGLGLNARGAVEVVIASVGLSLGVLSEAAYTAIVLMAIITSVMAAPLLRAAVRGWAGTEREQARLKREAALQANLLVRPGRLLLPSRGRPSSIAAAEVLDHVWPKEAGVTVLSIDNDETGEKPDLTPVVNVLHGREVEIRHVSERETLAAVLREARLGYTALAVGAAERSDEGRLLSAVVDEVLVKSPVPMVVVRQPRDNSHPLPAAFARALVPVSGTPSSRAAQELAFNLHRTLGTEVVLTHVVNRAGPTAANRSRGIAGAASAGAQETSPTAQGAGVTRQALALADESEVPAQSMIRHGFATGEEILAAAREADADLIVLGATVRRVGDRPFLGHVVEQVLDEAVATVVLVTVPEPTPADGATGEG